MASDAVDMECSACAFDQMMQYPSCLESHQPMCCTIHLGQFFSEFALQTLLDLQKYANQLFKDIQTQVTRRNLSAIKPLTYSSCKQAERIFNIVACVPGLGIVSSAIRVFGGKLQVVAGIALAAFSEYNLFIMKAFAKDHSLKEKWETLSDLGKEISIHGCFNVVRGTGEAFVSGYTFGLGNLMLIIPNIVNNQNFDPKIRYGSIAFSPAPQIEAINEAAPQHPGKK